ncbi:ectonucleotide pyrophosphatase/phosphodiesterase family member 5-like [Schistocerca gregaria]|uniref:ectonucleotide pyrophosphatase/phosphodiesterase family member 5-like n=1 Tax=Schistocerca gregaria TaxID=7010 RepID=UPI00211E234C|nr:ectonucleotide pyrophosphatase/phosphodiesterase family member 5-like [Schistocerca gregaria]
MYDTVFVFIAILLICIFTLFAVFYGSPTKPLLLVVSFDGFRYDYINKNVTPTLHSLHQRGVHSEYMRNVFITKTFPNHHSIATGLFPSSHGVMASSVYDERYGKVISYSEELWKFGNSVTPLWSLNEKLNHRSGVYMWPGGEFDYQGVLPTFLTTFKPSVSWTDRVDTVLKWFMDPVSPANLVFLYFEEPDSHSHLFGPESLEVLKQIMRCDNITKYLFDQIAITGLSSKLNVFLLSDHGMDSVSADRIINLTHYVNKTKYLTASTSPALHVIPKKGEFEDVYNALKVASEVENFTVYKRDELFERWHYNNERTPPLLLLADEGFAFDDVLYVPDSHQRNGSRTFGVHGYDNELQTMHSFFIAVGPLLKKNYTIQPFDSVDLYSLFCKILGLYSPPTNGSLSNVISMLKDDTEIKIHLKWITISGSVILLLCLFIFAVHLMRKARRLEEINSDYTLLSDREASEGWVTKSQQECHQADIQNLIQSEEE